MKRLIITLAARYCRKEAARFCQLGCISDEIEYQTAASLLLRLIGRAA